MTIKREHIENLLEAVTNDKATWHDFTKAFGAGSEHDPAVIGLRAYGGSLTCAFKLARMLIPHGIYVCGSTACGVGAADIVDADANPLAVITHESWPPEKALLIATLTAVKRKLEQ